MQRTEFGSSLIPQQANSNSNAACGLRDEVPKTNGHAAAGQAESANGDYSCAVASSPSPSRSPSRTHVPYLDLIRKNDLPNATLPDGASQPLKERSPDRSPNRVEKSPSWAPKYEAGVVSRNPKNLAPPPPGGGPPRAGGSPPPARGSGSWPVDSGSANNSWSSDARVSAGPPLPGLASFSQYQPGVERSPTRGSASGSVAGSVGGTPPNGSNSPTSPCRSPTRLPSGAVGLAPTSPASNRNSTKGDNTPAVGSPSRRRGSGLGAGRNNNNTGSSRIDPEQVPRPVGQAEAVKEEGGKRWETNKYYVPPPATTVATIQDRGSASCEFMRCTVNQVPAYPSTANTAHVPIAVICQPFAELTPLEEPVPLVDFGESGPLRCTRCKAYVNPHFTWQNHGRDAICNLCGHRIDVPDEYYMGTDANGRRKDHKERPELQRGTVDYIAPSDYSDAMPGLPTIAFVIEATQRSVQCGLLPQVLWTLRGLLNFMKWPASKIAIITFDHALHFYSFNRGAEGAHWITVTDIEDPFVPCSATALCIDALDEAYRSQVEGLIKDLTAQCQDTVAEQAAGGAALKAAVDLLGGSGGGHVIMFQASLQNTGIGALRVRDDLRLAKPEDNSAQFAAQQAPFFDAIAKDCLEKGVAVSVFCTPPVGVYIDVASLSVVPRRTGGDICYIPGYDPVVDGERLHYELSRTVVQNAVFSCVFKLRCSKGLAVEAMYATWEPEVIDPSTFTVSRMSVDGTVDFLLVHSERIEGQKPVYMQVACLHTDRNGRRLIRVHTLQLPVTSSLSNVFRYTEIDTVTNFLIKQAASLALNGNVNFKDKLSKSCVDMLHAYRANCASMTSAGQLILPESLKLLPLYVGSIRKMPAFRQGSDIRADDRLAALLRVLGLPMAMTAPLVYPRVYTMMPLPDRAGIRTDVGDNVFMPPTIACSSDKMALDRIYLLDTGSTLRLYIREEVSTENLQSWFGVSSPYEVAEALDRPEEELSDNAVRMLAIVWQIRRERTRLPWQPLTVVAKGTPEEAKLLASVCEDRVAGEMNYVDFLCHIHKLVQNKQD